MESQMENPATLLAPIPEITEIKSSPIPPVIPPNSCWGFVRNWWRRSDSSSDYAEGRLLARSKFFSADGQNEDKSTHSKTIVKVGLVDIGGENRKVNTLVIDQVEKSTTNSGTNPLPTPLEDDLRSVEFAGMGYRDKAQTDLVVQSNMVATNDPPKDKKVLVMAHGYGAGLGFFYRNYNALSQVSGWRIYAFDWLGMGRSSRPKWEIKIGSVDESENFFVDSLEDWRRVHGIEKFTLMGHSLGGYMSVCYALKYPERVERLVLVSPVGVPHNPESIEPSADESEPPKPQRRIPSWAKHLWNLNVTPFAIVRFAGPFGPYLVNSYTSRRFQHLDLDDQHDIYDYLYHISSASGSSEYALASVLAPGAYAKKPLISRLHGLKMPTTFIYGQQDWMDYKAAEEASKSMTVPTKIVRIPHGGHHMYLDNPPVFDRVMIAEMEKVKQGNRD